MGAGAITVDKTTFRYAEASRPALSDAHLTTEPGEFVLVADPSGCGKDDSKAESLSMISTLARLRIEN